MLLDALPHDTTWSMRGRLYLAELILTTELEDGSNSFTSLFINDIVMFIRHKSLTILSIAMPGCRTSHWSRLPKN